MVAEALGPVEEIGREEVTVAGADETGPVALPELGAEEAGALPEGAGPLPEGAGALPEGAGALGDSAGGVPAGGVPAEVPTGGAGGADWAGVDAGGALPSLDG